MQQRATTLFIFLGRAGRRLQIVHCCSPLFYGIVIFLGGEAGRLTPGLTREESLIPGTISLSQMSRVQARPKYSAMARTFVQASAIELAHIAEPQPILLKVSKKNCTFKNFFTCKNRQRGRGRERNALKAVGTHPPAPMPPTPPASGCGRTFARE